MDEPTASLDFGNQALVLREVRARSPRKATASCCRPTTPTTPSPARPRVALLHDGHLTAQGPLAEVLTAARLEAVYGVRVFIEHLAAGPTVNRRRTRHAAFRTLLAIGVALKAATSDMLIAPEARA